MMLLSVVPVDARRGRLPVGVFSESLEQLGEVQGRIGALGRVVQLPARLTIGQFPKMYLHPGCLPPGETRLEAVPIFRIVEQAARQFAGLSADLVRRPDLAAAPVSRDPLQTACV